MVAAEVAPYAKVGGLADVTGALPKALRQLGHEVRVMMPCHPGVDRDRWQLRGRLPPFTIAVGDETVEVSLLEGDMDGVPVGFVDMPAVLAGRSAVYEGDDRRCFLLFCAAAFACAERLQWRPDVIHAHDWHTAIVPALLKSGKAGPFFARTASVFTIHNLAYQGAGHRDGLGGTAALLPDDVRDEWVNLLALGLWSADVLTTVSPTYAREIMTPESGMGLDRVLSQRRDRLFGVLNGIDVELFDPATDSTIGACYDADEPAGKARCKEALQREAEFVPDPEIPVLGMVGRLADQKGFDLFATAAGPLLRETPLQLVVLGTGEPRYHAMLGQLQQQYPRRLRAWLTFDVALAQAIYAGADMFLMPSRFEPCGLGQLIAMRYGTVPIVRGTGGLVDTVQEGPPGEPRTGFVFWPYDVDELLGAVRRALAAYGRPDEWRRLMHNDMSVDSSWQRSAGRYAELYGRAITWQRG